MKLFKFNKATTPSMEVLPTSIYYHCTYEIANAAHMSNNAYFTTLTILSAITSSSQRHQIRSFTKPSRNIFTRACPCKTSPYKTSPCKASPCTRGAECWGQIFHATWLYFIGNPHRINIIMNFGIISFKAQKSPYLHKNVSKPMVQAHTHHLIFGSQSKVMSLIGVILEVVVLRAK